MIYKLKQSSGPMELWGTQENEPKQTNRAYENHNNKMDWHLSFRLICFVKSEHEDKFTAFAWMEHGIKTGFNQALSEGIIIPRERVGFEESCQDHCYCNIEEGGCKNPIKHAILIEAKEEGDTQDEFIKEIRYIFGDKMKSKEHQNDIVKQKFTIKRR